MPIPTRILNTVLHQPLALISAPAGYDRTMLASMWLDTCGCPNARLSVDESGNDLAAFTSDLLVAFRTESPTLELIARPLREVRIQPPPLVFARQRRHFNMFWLQATSKVQSITSNSTAWVFTARECGSQPHSGWGWAGNGRPLAHRFALGAGRR